jgi:hypothetical protein
MTLLVLRDKVTAHPEGGLRHAITSRVLLAVVAAERVWYKEVDTCRCGATYALFKEVHTHAFTPESRRLSSHA